MVYNYELMNGISFQKLAQALIVVDHPETQCLPVPQPDGGRDAFFYNNPIDKSDFVVFQVKFSANPKDKLERDSVSDLIKSEKSKIDKLVTLGAKEFYFITNVSGTAHLEVGSIDKVNAELTKTLGIPSYVWWRDDLDARINKNSDVKWSFPEIIKGSDVLQILLGSDAFKPNLEATRAFTAYVAKQKGADRDVKFKQVELTRKLTDLFVDLPIGRKGVSRNIRGGVDKRLFDAGLNYFDQLEIDEAFEYDDHPYEHKGLAAAFLLNCPYEPGVSRIVLEGAPGQGKSTVTQFLCQVNRLRILPNQTGELSATKLIYKSAQSRSPFRVDLRDFASWVSGKHPFAKDGEYPVPMEGKRSLESFLVMQVNWESGGLTIETNDLIDFLMNANSLIVLDGFDEVAAITTRVRVVEEINSAADRLDAQAKSLQIIVTSRPAAFANSPGFPEDDWMHLELKDLNRVNIDEYREKWATAQSLSKQDGAALSKVLNEKLEQPHLRDLARNPMQLAILLQLMHMQGAALPDKRTALYEEYMKIFLNREVEKKQIRGNDRELILELHGFLAWLLQTQTEMGESSGSISLEDLRSEVTSYLTGEEHDADLGEELLKNTVERVGALVSRVQGTFEFEVQPLREYFAARHLHKTAPYSPVGTTKKGTRPDRFLALSGNFYWTNVTRFFCGFYDKGELASLVEGIEQLSEDDRYSNISHPRRLSFMLLSDYVFSESPRTMRKLLEFVSSGNGFVRFIASERVNNHQTLSLPESGGQKIFFEMCAKRLEQEENSVRRRQIRRVMGQNASRSKRKEYWINHFNADTLKCDPFLCALDFGLSSVFSDEEIMNYHKGDLQTQLKWLKLKSSWRAILEDPELYSYAKNEFLNGSQTNFYRHQQTSKLTSGYEMLATLIQPNNLSEIFHVPNEFNISQLLMRYGPLSIGSKLRDEDEFDKFAKDLIGLIDGDVWQWKASYRKWEKLVDCGLKYAPGSNVFLSIALLSLGIRVDYLDEEIRALYPDEALEIESQPIAEWTSEGFSLTAGIVSRLHFALSKFEDEGWWKGQSLLVGGDESATYLKALLLVGSQSVIDHMKGYIETRLEALSVQEWDLFCRDIITVLRSIPTRFSDELHWFIRSDSVSFRLNYLMAVRVKTTKNCRKLGRICFSDYDGEDERILNTAFSWELNLEDTESGTEIDWSYFCEVSKKIASSNSAQGNYQPFTVEVPQDVAKDILENADQHCSAALSLAESSVSAKSSETAEKVSEVANENNWFAPT